MTLNQLQVLTEVQRSTNRGSHNVTHRQYREREQTNDVVLGPPREFAGSRVCSALLQLCTKHANMHTPDPTSDHP